ncbi:DUF2339 domain-containing protein [Acinetobacter haemolyticus]|uniref:DUF2339 domain-containing protein n=1 Tax=Acinetobacter haemolyticus TaxID=29430 RepID=UPI000D692500|nr:DUF2339 domain-containing protein [Acinetobacter haemolyticus]
MYKKDKQGIIIVLIALTVLLGCAVTFQWQATIVAAAIGLTVVIVHILSEIHQRLRQLEQAAPSYFVQTASITVQRIVIYSASLIALFAYANTWMWLAGGALLVLILRLIQTISAFQTRLLHLEQYHQVQSKTETLTKTPVLPQAQDSLIQEPFPQPTLSASEPQTQQPAWMRAGDQQPVHHQALQSSIDETRSEQFKQPVWWQPAADWMMHGNPILRVAVAVLMVGVILLLRFASEHWQLSLGAKLGFIASAGGITIFVGYALQKKNQLFAVALQGVGLAIVFLTLIFSHHFSVIASLTSASILFVVLLSLTVYLSLKQRALYLALLALTMAYLAPLVIPQQHPDVIFLFSYYFLINLAVAAVNFIQPWKILHQIAFFATMLIGGAVIGIYADRQQFNTLDIILWLHIALFIWLSVRYSQLMLRAQNQSIDSKSEIQGLQPILDIGLIFSVPVLGFSLHAYLMHNSTQALTWGAVALALIYLGLNIWIKRQYPQLSILAKSFFILAVVFLALIFPLAKGAHWTSTGWVIQGTALIVWGVTERYRLSRYIGVILVLLSSVALIFQVWSTEQFPILSTVIYALAQFISAFYLLHYQEVEKYFSARMLSGIFVILGMYAGAIAGVEFMQWQQHGLSPYLAIATGLLALYSLLVDYKKRVRWDRIQLILLAGLLVLLYGASFAANVYAVWHWPSALSQTTFAVAAVLLSLLLLRLKFSDSKMFTDIWSTLVWLSLAIVGLALFPVMPIIALAIVPLLYGLWSFSSKRMHLLHQLPVWCLTLFWLLLVSLDPYSAEQYYFLPLLNFTDILSLSMFAGLIWIIYHHDFSTERSIEWSFKVSTILMGLLVLSSVVVRAMHHYFNTPLWSVEIWSNGDVQLSLTLLWVILAFILMTFSSRRHIRQIWFVGAALLGIVVAKLLLLDLSQSGTLTRVISFIGSGAIMLVIAYLAPLPPTFEENRKEN